jgi:hypothetical protein
MSTLVEGKRGGTRVPPLAFPDRAMPTFSGIIVASGESLLLNVRVDH